MPADRGDVGEGRDRGRQGRGGPLRAAAVGGLVDRGAEVDLAPLAAAAVRAGGDDPERVADALLTGCDAAWPAQDDLSLVVLRLAQPARS